MILGPAFFDRSPLMLAPALLGKVLRHQYMDPATGEWWWLSARIIETEAYYRRERGSHSSLGFTEKRRAMFMRPGTIYMYYARGGDSLNFSARGAGNAVLVKSGHPLTDDRSPAGSVRVMQRLNPPANGEGSRPEARLCSGQTLLCRALGLEVSMWDQREPDPERFFVDDIGYRPEAIIRCHRLGIPAGRDEHLMYRFVDKRYARFATSNPLTRRGATKGIDYRELAGYPKK